MYLKRHILSGGSKLKGQTDYDGRIQGLLNKCNCQIDELESCAKKASPELREKCEHLISVLIANRETLKRGLLMVTDEGELRSSRSAA
jgi:hypothetical protein